MIKKVIYVGYMPLTEKVKQDFFLEEVKSSGIRVEFWDLSKIYFPKVVFPTYNNSYAMVFNSLLELENNLSIQEINQTLFISLMTYNGIILSLFNLFTKYNCQTAFFGRGALPPPIKNSKYFTSKFKYIFKPYKLLTYLTNKYALFQKKIGRIKPYDIIFSAGEQGLKTIGHGYHIEQLHSNIIKINSFDYDNYCRSKNCDNLVVKKYCLFLDEYLPYHQDFKMFGVKTIEPEEYYGSLNTFFNQIENKFNLEVVVAAHPKSERAKNDYYFRNRRVFYNKTSELTKFAEFSIAHCSSSISFSILYRKPIFFIYTNSLKINMSNYFNSILGFSKALGSCLINIDDYEIGEIDVRKIQLLKYIDYQYNYLTSKESERKQSLEIFLETITGL